MEVPRTQSPIQKYEVHLSAVKIHVLIKTENPCHGWALRVAARLTQNKFGIFEHKQKPQRDWLTDWLTSNRACLIVSGRCCRKAGSSHTPNGKPSFSRVSTHSCAHWRASLQCTHYQGESSHVGKDHFLCPSNKMGIPKIISKDLRNCLIVARVWGLGFRVSGFEPQLQVWQLLDSAKWRHMLLFFLMFSSKSQQTLDASMCHMLLTCACGQRSELSQSHQLHLLHPEYWTHVTSWAHDHICIHVKHPHGFGLR